MFITILRFYLILDGPDLYVYETRCEYIRNLHANVHHRVTTNEKGNGYISFKYFEYFIFID